jgi:hypothetical protein
MVDIYRGIVNFDFWRLRGDYEQTNDALEARKLIYQGDQAYNAADLESAKKNYEQGLEKWRVVLDKYPALLRESVLVDDLADMINRYRKILGNVDEALPEKFILQDVLDFKNSGNYQPPKPTEQSDDPTQQVPKKTQK